ncbi:MAG: leucyl-tRNA synthetase, partial [Parcubacteria group bacterium Gr01-1014_56]
GFILAEDGRKMSKRYGNVINPDDVVATYGADAFRTYEMFMGPFENTVAWNTASIAGTTRFIERVWRAQELVVEKNTDTLDTLLNQTIKKVSADITAFKFNTAVSQMMILLNAIEKEKTIGKKQWEAFLQLLAPFAPHVTEELWEKIGHKESIHISTWPTHDESKLVSSTAQVAVQVNGKLRATIELETGVGEMEALDAARADQNVAKWLALGKEEKAVYVHGKIVSFVVR